MTCSAVKLASNAHSTIEAGKRSWRFIRADPTQRHTEWFEVGRALNLGRSLTDEERGGLTFSEWVGQVFPGLDMNDEAPNGRWFTVDSSEAAQSG